MDEFFNDLLSIGGEAIRSGLQGVTVALKTNYGPEINIPVNGQGDSGSGITELLGIRGGLILRNRYGEVIETVGDPAPTDPLKFGALLAVLGVGAFVIVRGVIK